MKTLQRLTSIDIFRGITIFLMILVNTQAGGGFDFLIHISGYGWRVADLIYPSFIFIMGTTIYLSSRKYDKSSTLLLLRHILRRTILIFLIGIVFNWIPFNSNILDVRVMGVLQRIAIVYLACSLLVIKVRSITKLLIISGGILIGYGLLTSVSGYEVVDKFDLVVIGSKHLYTPTHDPEGLLSSIPAIVNAIIGFVSAKIMIETRERQDGLKKMAILSLSLIALSQLLNYTILPIYKAYWSSSFGLFTSGVSLFALIVVYLICDVWQKRDWGLIFNILGTNSIVCYLLSALIAEFFKKWGVANIIIEFYRGFMTPQLVSLSWGLTVVFLCLILIYPLYKRSIYIKV